MRARSLCALLAVVLSAGSAWAADLRGGQNVTVGVDEVVPQDLYAFGSVVRVDGVVKGDLVTTAGTVEVNGRIEGDVLALGGNILVTGPVKGSIRAGGGDIQLRGEVAEDVAVAGARLTVEPTAVIGRDVMATVGNIAVRGPVGGDINASAGELVLSAPVHGNVRATADTVRLTTNAIVDGRLTYASPKAAIIDPSVKVGSVEQLPLERARNQTPVVGFFYGWLRAIVAFTALGLVLAFLSPRFARAVPEVLASAPWKSLGFGALIVVAMPLGTALLFVLGALVGGWWLGLIAVAAFAIAAAISFPAIGYVVGEKLVALLKTQGARKYVVLLVGIAALTLAIRVPVVGALVGLITLFFGMGAVLLAALKVRGGGRFDSTLSA